jgi:anti-anti-sigma regulatory factor
LPASDTAIKVKVRISPTSGLDHFLVNSDYEGTKVSLKMFGRADAHAIPVLREELEKMVDLKPTTVVLDLTSLIEMSHIAMRSLIFAKQKLPTDEDMIVIGANDSVRAMFDNEEFSEEVTFMDPC